MARPAASRKKKRDKDKRRALNVNDLPSSTADVPVTAQSSTVSTLMTALSDASGSTATAASTLANTASTLATAASTSAKASPASTAPAPVPTRKPKGATGASTGQIDRPPPYKEGQSQRDDDKKMPALVDDLGHEGKGVDNMIACGSCANCLKARSDAIDQIWDRNEAGFHEAYLRLKNQARRSPNDGKLVESLKVLHEHILLQKDLRKVVQWASIKIVRLTVVPPGEGALNQLFEILTSSAERGMLERLKKLERLMKEVRLKKETSKKLKTLKQLERLNQAETMQKGLMLVKELMTQHVQQSRQALAAAVKPTEARKDVMEQEVEALTNKPSPPQGVKAKEEKMVNVIPRAPMTDEAYDEISARTLFLKSLLPDYSQDDMVRLVQHYGEVETFKFIFDSGTKNGCQSAFFTMTSCEAANAAFAGLKDMMFNGNMLWVDRPPPARETRTILQTHARDKSRANENIAVSSSTALTGEQTIRERRAKEATVAPRHASADDKSGAHKKRTCAVTKWDLLRGLRCVTEESLQFDETAGAEQFHEIYDFHVLNARNLSIGAYTILRRDLLADNIGRVYNENTDLNNPEGVHMADPDPITRRWKTLTRDFPDVEIMVMKGLAETRRASCPGCSAQHPSSSCT